MFEIKAVIVVPPSPFLDRDDVFPPLGALYIKRFVEENSNHIVYINDFPPYDAHFDECGVIGFSCTTPQFKSYRDVIWNASNVVGRRVLVGGSHYGVPFHGDGCKPFLNVLDGKEPGRELDDNDQLPHRDETLHNYKYEIDGDPATTIITSKGCPYRCYFCEDAGLPVRIKSVKAVKKEIQECVDLKFSGLMFFDDLFCVNLKRVKELCEVIKPFNIKFRCYAHARTFTPAMARLLVEAGCTDLAFGAESGSQKILDIINKRTTVLQNYEIVRTAHDAGLRIKAFMMLGLPGETHETAKAMEAFVLNAGLDAWNLGIYHPYRGTYIADHIDQFDLEIVPEIEDEGYIMGKGGHATCITRTKDLDREDILDWHSRILKHNPRYQK